MIEFIRSLTDWYFNNLNYVTVFLLMVLESTFLPLPSEFILPPAAFKAAAGSDLNIVLVILVGTMGSMVGSSINYFLAAGLGRPAVHALSRTRLAHMLFVHERSVVHAENFFNRYGRSATFFGRLIPAVRHLLSIAAGLARMPLGRFWLYTALGAGLWATVLGSLSYSLVLIYGTKNVQDIFDRYFKEISWGLVALGLILVAVLVWRLWKGKQNVITPSDGSAPPNP